ncbi:hypothetical protein [Flavobacterium terrae]|uniref:Uncharacterized protein n=1 Tax=Flavobacterium terrae TaxID=415425 RepID=A0A1M6BF48_9FLAO|nr:hypothetical protein [Flavobacterium terrae]SHI47362.1 hypothetical protein SAMN05444363_0722 [Flavobacterium terrae]
MKINKIENFDLSKFEALEVKGETLKGGFSIALVGGLKEAVGDEGTTNNCNGGNCVAGCGTGQTVNKFICAS